MKALVTGASRGIGKAVSLALLEQGYEVLGTSTTEVGAKNLDELGIMGFVLDLQENIEPFIQKISNKHPDISVLVNNAGMTKDNIVLRMSEKEWMDVIDVHLNSNFKLTKAVLKMLLKKKWGRIINISSTSATIGNKGQSNYASAKAGLEAFTKSLAKEVGSRNITVNSVAPGFIDTDMTNLNKGVDKNILLKKIPLKRFGKPEEVAKLVTFICSEEASYITGQTIHINGGLYM
tara:strand:- start:10744 stop:11445 length:702 start_codon:yes stop_codon:yes gene_type:complete